MSQAEDDKIEKIMEGMARDARQVSRGMNHFRCIALFHTGSHEVWGTKDKDAAVAWCHKRATSLLLWALVIDLRDATVYYHTDQRP